MRRQVPRLWLFALVAFASTLGSAAPVEKREFSSSPRGQIERVLRDGLLAEERVFGSEGVLEEESIFAKGVLVQRNLYIRVGGRLVKIEASDGSGESAGTMEYRYDGAGRLVAIETTGIFGDGGAGLVLLQGKPQVAWTRIDGASEIRRFDEKGRASLLVTCLDSKAVSRETRSYGDGPFPVLSVVEDIGSGVTIRVEYDGKGKPNQRTESLNGRERSRITYRYGDDGRLVEESTRAAGTLSSRILSYDGAGKLSDEEDRLNGEISRTIAFSGDERVEELYHSGLLFARVSYSGGRKIKEEFFDGASVARTRIYP